LLLEKFNNIFLFIYGTPNRSGFLGQYLLVNINGYLYFYESNETPNVYVFFDNLQVTHIRGPLLEETHFYPFGLTMAGISSKAVGKLENKNDKFQGQPLDDDLGLNWYGFKWRNHDFQIGRFVQIDPLSNEYVYNSTYAFSENKVTNHVELEGLEAVSAHKLQTIKDGYGNKINRTYSVNLTNSKMTAEQIYQSIGSNFSKYTEGVSYFEKINGQSGKLAVGDEFSITGGPHFHSSPISDIKNHFPTSGGQLLDAQKNYVDEQTGTYNWGDIHTGVTVTGIITKPNESYSFTLGTWEGHVEAGQISFTAIQGKNGNVSFSINSSSKSSNFFTDKAYRFLGGQENQTKHWETFLNNLIKISGSNSTQIQETTKKTKD
jgi:RHS repeat-associated protein